VTLLRRRRHHHHSRPRGTSTAIAIRIDRFAVPIQEITTSICLPKK